VVELKSERENGEPPINSVFKGVVKRRCNSLNGYFVDVGLEDEALLQKKPECNALKEGDEVIVQLKRKKTLTKGPRLSCRISLPGKYLVYFPTARKLGVSGRIRDLPFAKKLKELLEKVLKENEGVIVRSSAVKAKEDELLDELSQLRRLWEEIKERAKKVKKGLLWRELPLWARVVRDYWGQIKEVVVDDPEVWKGLAEAFGSELSGKLRFSRNLDKVLGRHTLKNLIDRLFSRYVWLSGGGFLVIEETEAMVVIDVNSGEGCGDSLEENALRTNLKALQEVARQIRFRNLGGIIVVDLIDVRNEEHRRKLLEESKRIFEREGVRVKIYELSKLNLLEMTRRKEEQSALRELSEECPACRGLGLIKSKELVLYFIEQELDSFKGTKLELRVHPRLVEAVRKLVREKKLEPWVSIKEVWHENPNYYELLPSEPY